jgi:hypothetical protein
VHTNIICLYINQSVATTPTNPIANKVKSEYNYTRRYAIMNILFVAIHSLRKDGSRRNKKETKKGV